MTPSSSLPSRPPLAAQPRSDLRPDLAAFFAVAARELAPQRLAAEHGVLAELRRRNGSD